MMLFFLFPFPLKTPLNMLLPLQSRRVHFPLFPSQRGQKVLLRRKLEARATFAEKTHLSGPGSAELSAWQAVPWPQFGKGSGESLPTEAQIILPDAYFQLQPEQGAVRCPALPGASTREAGPSGTFWALSCPRRGAEPAGLSSRGETAL